MSAPETLHIAYLLTQSLDSPSGLGRYGPLARSLAQRGHRVEVYALHPDFHAEQAAPYDDQGVQVQYVAPMHVKKQGNLKTYYSPLGLAQVAAQATWELYRAARQSAATILHICKPHPMNGLAGLVGAWGGRKTVWVDCDDYEAGSNLFTSRWQRPVVAWFERNLPRRAQAVTTNSHWMARQLAAWGLPQASIHYLPNGFEPRRFARPAPAAVAALKTTLGLTGQRVVGYIGSLSLSNHAVDLLLEAFCQLQPQAPDTRLVIVGGGEDYPTLQQRAQDMGISGQVSFTGRIAPEQVAAYYALLDVSVDPVRDDPAARGRAPLKMFESWACGVPFVTSAVGDRAALLGSPPAGRLAAAADAHGLAAAILEILNDPALAAELRRRGQALAPQYTWDYLAQSVEALYQAHRPGPPIQP